MNDLIIIKAVESIEIFGIFWPRLPEESCGSSTIPPPCCTVRATFLVDFSCNNEVRKLSSFYVLVAPILFKIILPAAPQHAPYFVARSIAYPSLPPICK